jgi:uncharacterized protein (TIGR00251 family)
MWTGRRLRSLNKQAMTRRVKVIPRSSKTEMAGEMADGTLKVKIAAPPEKGKANEALCTFLAAHYGVPRSAVTIVSGHSAALKLVRVAGAA